MRVYKIEEIADFMNKLLAGQVFDKFLFLKGDVETFASFQLDGQLNASYYSSDETAALEGRTLALWSQIRPAAYQLIKGKKLPVQFSFVLQLSEANTDWLLDKHHLTQYAPQLAGLYLNIRYKDKMLICTTGLSYNTFVPDRTLEHVWDETAGTFLKQNKIVFSEV